MTLFAERNPESAAMNSRLTRSCVALLLGGLSTFLLASCSTSDGPGAEFAPRILHQVAARSEPQPGGSSASGQSIQGALLQGTDIWVDMPGHLYSTSASGTPADITPPSWPALGFNRPYPSPNSNGTLWETVATDTGSVLAASSENGGADWNITTVITGLSPAVGLSSTISYVNSQLAWVSVLSGHVGVSAQSSIYETTDGGSNWTAEGGLQEMGPAIFGSPSTGLAVSVDQGNAVDVTANGGQTWTKETLPVPSGYSSTGGSLELPQFITPDEAFVPASFVNPDASTPAIFVIDSTTDGGTSWSQVEMPQGAFAFAAITPTSWVAVGTNGSQSTFVAQTVNAGQTWTEANTNLSLEGIRDLQFVSPEVGIGLWTGWECPSSGPTSCPPTSSLLRTGDGGSTWTVIPLP